MIITVREMDQICIVSVCGSIDALTAEEVTDCMTESINKGAKNIMLDLTEVDFMSSAGLRSILGALKNTRKVGGDLCVAGSQPRVAKVLQLSGFLNLLRDFASVEDAMERFTA